jgi:two-component system, NarL family, response regulator DevR
MVDKKVEVLLYFQNRLVRESIARILEKKIDLQIVAAKPLTSVSEQEISQSSADVLVIDSLQFILEMAASIPRLGSKERPLGCVLVAMADEPKRFLMAVSRGVSGYVLQDASATDVTAAIRAVARGEAICPPHYTRLLFNYVAEMMSDVPSGRRRSTVGLTGREQELIPLIRRGLTNKEIASRLGLSEQTVKNHVHRILRKLGAEDRLEVSEACVTQMLAI